MRRTRSGRKRPSVHDVAIAVDEVRRVVLDDETLEAIGLLPSPSDHLRNLTRCFPDVSPLGSDTDAARLAFHNDQVVLELHHAVYLAALDGGAVDDVVEEVRRCFAARQDASEELDRIVV